MCVNIKLAKSPCLGKVISPSGEATAVVLPSEHDVSVKLSSKYLCLYPQFSAARSCGHGNFVF